MHLSSVLAALALSALPINALPEPQQPVEPKSSLAEDFYLAAVDYTNLSTAANFKGLVTVNRYPGTNQAQYQFGIIRDRLPADYANPSPLEVANFQLEEGNLKYKGFETDDSTQLNTALTLLPEDQPHGTIAIQKWDGKIGDLALDGITDGIWNICPNPGFDFSTIVPAFNKSNEDFGCTRVTLNVILATAFSLAEWCPTCQAYCGTSTTSLTAVEPNTIPTTVNGATVDTSAETKTWPGLVPANSTVASSEYTFTTPADAFGPPATASWPAETTTTTSPISWTPEGPTTISPVPWTPDGPTTATASWDPEMTATTSSTSTADVQTDRGDNAISWVDEDGHTYYTALSKGTSTSSTTTLGEALRVAIPTTGVDTTTFINAATAAQPTTFITSVS